MTARATRRTATGHSEEAWKRAPERLRQSQIDRPFIPRPVGQPGLLARLFGRG